MAIIQPSPRMTEDEIWSYLLAEGHTGILLTLRWDNTKLTGS